MLRNSMFNSGAILILCVGAYGQNPAAPFSGPAPEPERTVPVYKVTVVERSFQAVNYQYRSGPTEIDFKGTVLLPNSKGHATVESKRGGTDIDAKFDKLTPPTPFGRQYLTYVLWAISPEGAPHNLGEVVANGGDSARLHVTTDLQVFGLLVTAEPYSAVRQPSDVVVMENQVRWDTIGRTQPIVAKAELLSRGQFTYDKQAGMAAAAVNTPRISMDEYEKLLEIYQAENAIGIARAAHADELAPETFFKAQAAYDEARRLLDGRVGVSLVVQSARAAAQTADDARMIALRRAQEARVANAELQAEQAKSEAQQARVDADAARAQVDSARAQADAARAQAESERIARQQAESQAAQAPSSQDLPIAPPPPAPVAPPPARSPIAYQPQPDRQQQQARMRMLERLNSVAVTRDTPRGLVTTLTDMNFDGGTLRPSASDVLARLAPVLMQPGVRVSVEGYSDSAAGAAMSERRVDAVRDMLARRGVASVTTRNFADARPLTSNATAEGRMENRRVEIVISGDAVGSQPLWDRSYDVTLRQ